MKKFHSLRPILTVVSLAATLACLPRSVVAENKPPGPSGNTPSAVAENNPPAPVGLGQSGFDLEVKDGQLVKSTKGRGSEATLGNAVDALRDRYTTVNIVVAPGLAKVKLSDLKLRAGQLADELEAIRVASGSKFEWVGPGSAGPNLPPGSSAQAVDPNTGQLTATASTESNTGLFILREPTPTPETARTLEAFNISGYLQWLNDKQDPKETKERRVQAVTARLEELEQMIQLGIAGLKPDGGFELPVFRFHPGANLLIIVGMRGSVEVGRIIVNALPGQAGQATGESNPSGPFANAGMSPELAKRYGLLAPTAPPVPAPPR